MHLPPVPFVPYVLPALLGMGLGLGLWGIAVLLAGVTIPVLPPPGRDGAHHRRRRPFRWSREHVVPRGRRHLTGAGR